MHSTITHTHTHAHTNEGGKPVQEVALLQTDSRPVRDLPAELCRDMILNPLPLVTGRHGDGYDAAGVGGEEPVQAEGQLHATEVALHEALGEDKDDLSAEMNCLVVCMYIHTHVRACTYTRVTHSYYIYKHTQIHTYVHCTHTQNIGTCQYTCTHTRIHIYKSHLCKIHKEIYDVKLCRCNIPFKAHAQRPTNNVQQSTSSEKKPNLICIIFSHAI